MAWKYSKARLEELETELAAIDARQRVLDIAGPSAQGARFADAADFDEYNNLTKLAVLTTNERDRCAMVLWRRERQRTA